MYSRKVSPITKLSIRPILNGRCLPLRMLASAQKIGMLLPHSTKLMGMASSSGGASMPASGHSVDAARRKK